MQQVHFPLNEIQVSLLKLTENMTKEELLELKKLIIAFKAQRLAVLADEVWEKKGWTQETMHQFLQAHMRTPYKSGHSNNKA